MVNSKDFKMLNIQGLRALSIVAVLIFHLRPDISGMGHLGVDVFFVISGFLMSKILSSKMPLDIIKICDYYFRRLRRIVPLYLFTILSVLITSIVMLFKLDYSILVDECVRPMLFIANWPADGAVEYSRRDESNYQFFKHLWSLSLETQFYAISPLLFIVFFYFGKFFQIVLVFSIAIASFLFQWIVEGDIQHMALSSRLWQFMCGFLSYDCFVFLRNREGKNENASLLKLFVTYSLFSSLAIGLFMPLIPERQLNRLLITLISSLFLVLSDQDNIIFKWISELGNVSYSIYLIHWPLIEAHKYINLDNYIDSGGFPSINETVMLFLLSVLLGFLVENFYNVLSANISCWKGLIFTISILYLMIFECLFCLKLNEGDVDLKSFQGSYSFETHNQEMLVHDVLDMWSGKFKKEISPSRAIYYNQQYHLLAWDLVTCPNQSRHAIPTNFDVESKVGFGNTRNSVVGITGSCVMEGNGSKNIVIFGNSHAQASFFGVEYHLRGLYKHLTMFSAGACMLISGWEGRIPVPSKKTYDGCIRLIRNLETILKEWKHPIHIIIMVHAYLYPFEIINKSVPDLEADLAFQEMRLLFEKLGNIAREVVFIPQAHFQTGVISHTNVLYRRILTGQSLQIFQIGYEQEHRRAFNIKKRIEAAKCSKCVILEWEDIWCDKKAYCNSVDYQHNISYFFDSNHVNAYGALYVGEYIRHKYEEWSNEFISDK